MATETNAQIAVLTGYSLEFLYSVCQSIASNQKVLNGGNFYSNLQAAYTELKNAQTAGLYNDQQAAQSALDRIKYLIDNKKTLLI